jgi:phosphatidate phosphatase APP1
LGLKRDDEKTKILKRRVGPFLVDNERRKELVVQLGCTDNSGESCRVFPLPQSKKNGHFEAMLNIDDEELAAIQEATCDEKNTVHYQAVVEDSDERIFEGLAMLISPTGISVISDIDDTVKITGVGDKRALLRSTFMEEFKEVPGMAQMYQQWASDMDAKFHFVSSSPWQLWEELETFLSRVGFPMATFHLKPIRLKDRTLLNLWKCPLETKIAVIESILESFPLRQFLLVGDTGEKDPEVYGEIARRYPNQIKGIYVRNVTNETGEEERYQEAWVDVNPEICHVFTDPSSVKLPSTLLPPTAPEPAVNP